MDEKVMALATLQAAQEAANWAFWSDDRDMGCGYSDLFGCMCFPSSGAKKA
ncbi:Uncharacterised protein [Citrobacter freundii]|nr:Uncharacterised protein [Citrobacter freundii]